MTETVDLEDHIRDTMLRIMGVLYEANIVQDIHLRSMVALMTENADIADKFEDLWVEFDDGFFNDYFDLTGVDLRKSKTMMH